MDDWRSYDAIAAAYDRIWAPRLETVARYLLALSAPAESARLLDVGTGTGALLRALGEELRKLRSATGCDLSFSMLRHARRHLPELRPIVADATQLPFRGGTFDLVTANCVLSHLDDYRRALTEVVRVLARPGVFAASCWGPALDVFAAAWKESLDASVGEGAAQRATETVAPWESHFSSPPNLKAALIDAGFDCVRVEVRPLSIGQSVDEYLADRQLTAGGRFARHVLGAVEWPRFLERADAEFRRRFGERVSFDRPIVLAVATLD